MWVNKAKGVLKTFDLSPSCSRESQHSCHLNKVTRLNLSSHSWFNLSSLLEKGVNADDRRLDWLTNKKQCLFNILLTGRRFQKRSTFCLSNKTPSPHCRPTRSHYAETQSRCSKHTNTALPWAAFLLLCLILSEAKPEGAAFVAVRLMKVICYIL